MGLLHQIIPLTILTTRDEGILIIVVIISFTNYRKPVAMKCFLLRFRVNLSVCQGCLSFLLSHQGWVAPLALAMLQRWYGSVGGRQCCGLGQRLGCTPL